MKRHVISFLLVLVVASACAQKDQSITTFILLRHAEKGNDGTDDPNLTPEGLERSNRIVAMLKNTAVDAVYSTHYKRAKNTIAPLAQSKGLQVLSYEAHQPEVIEAMIKKHQGGTIVVCGHSN